MRAVDLFAGAGGWSTAAARVGLEVVAAVNHWPVAVATHQANHPSTVHFCASLHGFDPRSVDRPVVVLASPSCTGHTRARGTERAEHDAARATAHAVTDLVEAWRPDWVFVENVPEMLAWERWRSWSLGFEDMGYRTAHTVLCASEFGFPQMRKRLYYVACRTGDVPRLPVPPLLRGPAATVESVIDWSEPGEPIGDRFGAVTMAQIAAGKLAYGSRFLVPYYGSQRAAVQVCRVDRPCGAVTTHDRYLVVSGDRARFLTPAELLRLQGFPADYRLCGRGFGAVKIFCAFCYHALGHIRGGPMDADTPIAPPDALWLSALVRDRARAEARLRDVLPGRDVQAAAEVAARCVHAELDRAARVAARPVRGAMVAREIARWLARRKRREPATRRRWAIMAQRRPCELVPPPWWEELRRGEEYHYDAGAEWGVLATGAPMR